MDTDTGAQAPTGRQTHAQAVTQLALRVQRGDDHAWEPLWRALWGPMLAFLRKRDLPLHDAEDVAATVLLRVYKGIPSYDPSLGSAFTWVMQITANEYANFWRMQTQQKRDYRKTDSTEKPVKGDGEGEEQTLGDTLSSDDNTLERMYWLEQTERARRLARERVRNPITGKTGGRPSLAPRVLDLALQHGTASCLELTTLTDELTFPQLKAGLARLRDNVGPRLEWD